MNNIGTQIRVLIAGIGGASLGTEICKSLNLAGKYEVHGCDISSTAYGLYDNGFHQTYRITREDYVQQVLDVCLDAGINWLIPGGEEPNSLLGAASELFLKNGVRLVTNDAATVKLFSDKDATFKQLSNCGVSIPKTMELCASSDVKQVGLPCIVKPATGTGGSASVFFAVTADEALTYADFIRRNGSKPIVQEYVDDEEGEFTIGVLSLPSGKVAGSIALRRVLDAKLSVAYRGRGGVISSGYSQGYIDEFRDYCTQAERIARMVKSRGPINIQARIRDGILIPFEINPRFSASTYLRALAGFNEVDMLLSHLISGETPTCEPPKAGWYLRSLTEEYVPAEGVK